MKISLKVLGIGTAVFILGCILVLMAVDAWKTESTKTPAKYTTGQFAGLNNPSDIRGSYSFADVEKNFKVTATDLAKAFALDTSVKSAGEYLAKDLETVYGEQANGGEVGTDSIRWFVALYLGLPHTPEETTLLPNPALTLLRDAGKINEDTFQTLKAKSVSPSGTAATVSETHVESSEEKLIKGNTTYGDLLEWGLSRQQIEQVMGFAFTDRALKLRDDLGARGLEFSGYKTALQALIDAL